MYKNHRRARLYYLFGAARNPDGSSWLATAAVPFAGVLARYRWRSQVPFSIGFWSFSFPLAALASAVIEVTHRGGWSPWFGHAALLCVMRRNGNRDAHVPNSPIVSVQCKAASRVSPKLPPALHQYQLQPRTRLQGFRHPTSPLIAD